LHTSRGVAGSVQSHLPATLDTSRIQRQPQIPRGVFRDIEISQTIR